MMYMKSKTKRIRQVVYIPAKPMDVYEAIMDPEKHARFTEDVASGSREVGGIFNSYNGYITAKNIELIPGKKIVQEWITSEWPEGYQPSILHIELKEVEGETQLIMKHTLVPTIQADDYDKGWHEHYWDKLKKHFTEVREISGKKT